MKRTRRSCVDVSSISASKPPQKSKDSGKEEAAKVEKEKMLTNKEEIVSSDESEIENQSPVKKRKGDDYLKMIEENRQKNMAFLQSLNIEEVRDSFCSSVKALKPATVKREYKPKPVLPLRKSERLANVNKKPLDLPKAKQKVEKTEKQEVEKTEKQEVEKFEKGFQYEYKFEDYVVEMEDFSNFRKHFSDLDFKDPPKPIQFPDHFKRMKIKESLDARVGSGVSSLTVHPSINQVIVAAGGRNGNIGFWNVTSNSSCMFYCHNQGISNIKFNTHVPHKIMSSSFDGRLVCGDMEKLSFEICYESADNSFSCFDILSSSTFIVGDTSGEVAIVDCRSSFIGVNFLRKHVKKHNCNKMKINCVSVHPVDQNYFASSDCTGIIKVWDLRQLKKEPLCENRHHHIRSVPSIFFSPATGKSILSTCRDDHCCIFDSSDLSEGLIVENNIRHRNALGAAFPLLQAVWVPNADEQLFAVGSWSLRRQVEVFNRQGSLVYKFFDENLNSVLSQLDFHSSLPVFAGGDSSGKVTVFQDL